MPQRWSCRQSYLAGPYSRGGVFMSAGFSPARTRRATSVVALVPAETEAIGPPTISPVKKASLKEKNWRVGDCEQLRQRSIPFVRCAEGVDLWLNPEDGTVRRQRCRLLESFVEGQLVIEEKRDAVLQRLQLSFHL